MEEYPCPKCKNGKVKKYFLTKDKRTYRWTCNFCDRDFGYDTPEPVFEV